ncbi:hypothetical protein FACS189426_12780 [Bacteroidia bacterium]|nr:hypothetical protein FACS189426_12780 [Bacteroidia bacterium]
MKKTGGIFRINDMYKLLGTIHYRQADNVFSLIYNPVSGANTAIACVVIQISDFTAAKEKNLEQKTGIL